MTLDAQDSHLRELLLRVRCHIQCFETEQAMFPKVWMKQDQHGLDAAQACLAKLTRLVSMAPAIRARWETRRVDRITAPATDAFVRKRHAQGATLQAIGDELGVSRQRVQQIGKRLGLVWARDRKGQSGLKRLPDLLRQGLTNDEIADSLDMSPNWVATLIEALPNREALLRARKQAQRHAGSYTGQATARRQKRESKVVALMGKGVPMEEIARRLGVSVSTVATDWRVLGAARSPHVEKRLKRVGALLAKGHTLQEIAERLGVSKGTIKTDVRLIEARAK